MNTEEEIRILKEKISYLENQIKNLIKSNDARTRREKPPLIWEEDNASKEYEDEDRSDFY